MSGIEVQNKPLSLSRQFPMKRENWLFLVLATLIAPAALALDIVPYEADGFARARRAGRVTAVQFHSGWCPICVMQERGLKSLSEDKALAQVTVFQADYFKEEALRKRFNVSSFSTLVVFRGALERARTTGHFQPEQLRQLFAGAL